MTRALDTERRDNRVPVMLSADELRQIDDWRYANRAATRSEAIRRLIAVGLEMAQEGDPS